jgi:hypothetical protein
MSPETTAELLAAALPALRLNKAYPDWRAIQSHLLALSVPCPDHPLALHASWPDSAAWMRVRVDHDLARDVLPTLGTGGGRRMALQRAYLTAMASATVLPPSNTVVRLVEQRGDHLRIEVVHDAHELAVPRLARIVVRMDVLAGQGATLHPNGPVLTDTLEAAIRRLPDAPAAETLALHALGDVESVTIGTVGPARTGIRGPWLSAALTRLSADLRSSRVDDPLHDNIVLPAPERADRMSHIRKWAVPAPDVSAARQWLSERGRHNMVYAYALPEAA